MTTAGRPGPWEIRSDEPGRLQRSRPALLFAPGTDRRRILTGLGALALVGCSGHRASAVREPRRRIRVDFASLETRHRGRLGLVAQTSGGDCVEWRASERFVYCSTFKMFLAAATLERIQRGKETFERAVPVTQADMTNHAPVTRLAIGSSLSIERLMRAVVEVSDNPAANLLIRGLGGIDALRAWYRSIGDESTRVDRLEPTLNLPDGDKDTITPRQSANNLHHLLLSTRTPLTPENRARLLGWMFDSPTGPDRIKAGVPAGWRVAHKTGTGDKGPTNDIGLAYPPSGRPVVIAAYYHGPSDSSVPANEAAIAEAVRLAIAALAHTA